MGKVIEFYIPARFHKKAKGMQAEHPSKVIEFAAQATKSA
jgi:hypothetical protein